jgi:hypothetical protein
MRRRRLSEAIYPVADEAGIPNPDSVACDLAKFMMSTVDGMMTGLRLDDAPGTEDAAHRHNGRH